MKLRTATTLALAAALLVCATACSKPAAPAATTAAPAATTAAPAATQAAAPAATTAAAPAATEAAKTVDFPAGKPITLLIGYGAGGGSDITIRTAVPYIEKALGTTITCVNKKGAGGWVAWEELTNAKPDGYTIAMVNFPNVFAGYLDPSTGRDKNLQSFQLLGNLVSDYSCIAVKKGDERFPDLQAFIDYAKENITTIGTAGAGSDDEVALNQMIQATGADKIEYVRGAGWSEMYPAVLGGHADAAGTNVGECFAAYTNGELDVLCVFSEERSPLMPDVPTFKEITGTLISGASMRGLAMPAGADPAIVEIFDKALKEAMADPKLAEEYVAQGLLLDYYDSADYTKIQEEQEQVIKGMSKLMGWE